ncbi:hypothetical protein QKW60_05510 [Defluviimonas aestuarii]|uniref:hypothetical protein n=1 Tax=Albidovulum aestuarii TaxID=1130726 RepID=UPI00249CBA88|nr:hypothetical protein [Defluviimonas aestuarii]MDI3335853.1 hypothetical protein [Defluviimonas aestuarii]
MSKPLEFWIALSVGVLIVIERHREKSAIARAIIAAISGGIGYSLAPEAAALTGRSETMAVMILTAFGYLLLDLGAALIADRELIRDVIKRRLGGGK